MVFDGKIDALRRWNHRKAKSENITIIKLPAHSTDILQPLDKYCFRPLKILWYKDLISWKMTNQ